MNESVATRKAEPVTPEILVHKEWCKGCGFCVVSCRRGVLRMEDKVPVVVDANLCSRCELCVWICPEFALKVR